MIFISGAAQPVAKIDQLKGKTQTPETIEVNLAELIDVKGMKAMGNRVSQHTIQSIDLLAVEEPQEADAEPEEIAEMGETPSPDIEEASEAPSPEVTNKPADAPPAKKIDFEITNPDDIDIDDKGQIGLF